MKIVASANQKTSLPLRKFLPSSTVGGENSDGPRLGSLDLPTSVYMESKERSDQPRERKVDCKMTSQKIQSHLLEQYCIA